jgi:hypothetical protein
MDSISDANKRMFYWLTFGGLAVALFCVYAFDRVGLTGEQQDQLIKNYSAGCTKVHLANPEDAKYPASLIEQYCTCVATGVANRITKRELAEWRATRGESFKTERQEIEGSCAKPLVERTESK